MEEFKKLENTFSKFIDKAVEGAERRVKRRLT